METVGEMACWAEALRHACHTLGHTCPPALLAKLQVPSPHPESAPFLLIELPL